MFLINRHLLACFLFVLLTSRTTLLLAGSESIFDQVGQTENVRPDILWAMALQESGYPESNTPWPWTANINGHSYYFANKNQAVGYTSQMIKKGAMVDVGLMQVNWNYHYDKFESLAQAFNPIVNLTVAARILKQFSQYPLWTAVGKYHCPSDIDWCQQKAYRYALNVHKRLMNYESN